LFLFKQFDSYGSVKQSPVGFWGFLSSTGCYGNEHFDLPLLWWLAFRLIRGTAGRERLFMVGWFVGILLRPLKILGPQWAMATKHIGAFALAVALLAVVALLLEPPVVCESRGPN